MYIFWVNNDITIPVIVEKTYEHRNRFSSINLAIYELNSNLHEIWITSWLKLISSQSVNMRILFNSLRLTTGKDASGCTWSFVMEELLIVLWQVNSYNIRAGFSPLDCNLLGFLRNWEWFMLHLECSGMFLFSLIQIYEFFNWGTFLLNSMQFVFFINSNFQLMFKKHFVKISIFIYIINDSSLHCDVWKTVYGKK